MKMRNERTGCDRLLAGVARATLVAAALVAASPGAARAQGIPVIDAAGLAQAVQQVEQGMRQLDALRQQLAQAQQLYGSLSRATDVAGIARGLDGLGRALPDNAYDAGRLLSGSSTALSTLGRAGGLADGFLGGNRVYAPPGGDFGAQEMLRNARSIAGSLGMAQQLYQTAVDRLPGLQELRDRLATATDPKESMDLQARIGAEQAFIANQQQQAQAMLMWQAAEERNTQQRRDEERRRDLDDTAQALMR